MVPRALADSWITAWTIELVPRWGQYQNCNGYGDEHVCLGANTALVGHEAAEGLGAPAGGQCTNNPEVGEWWSLPMAAECLGASQVQWRRRHHLAPFLPARSLPATIVTTSSSRTAYFDHKEAQNLNWSGTQSFLSTGVGL